MSMHLLLLTKKVPFPQRDGESVAIHNMVVALRGQGIVVDLLTFNTSKHYVDIDEHGDYTSYYNRIESVDLDNRVKVMPALTNLLGSKSYHIERFVSDGYRSALVGMLDTSYDIIQMESIFLGPYLSVIRKHSKAPVVLRTHNVETLIWKRLATDASLPKRQYLTLQSKRLEKFESTILQKVDAVIPMSDADASVLVAMGMNVMYDTIPISLNMNLYERHAESPMEGAICFIGTLDWQPNVQGLEWFIDEIWPSIRKFSPHLSFHVAGRKANDALIAKMIDADIHFHGEVPDAVDFIAKHKIMVVPLLSGSGQRVKILEAMAVGIPVVATTIGAEGISVENNHDILLSDYSEQFARCVAMLEKDTKFSSKIAHNGRLLIEKNYSTENTGRRYVSIYEQLVDRQSES